MSKVQTRHTGLQRRAIRRTCNPLRICCIIPTFNRGMILIDTVRQLLAQTIRAHEILVVDQTIAPDENTRQALYDWNALGSIRWLHQREPNASLARNQGAFAATGDVLLFLDDDIRVAEDFLETYACAFAGPDVRGVAGQILEGTGETVVQLPPGALDPESGWMHFPRNYARSCETSWLASGNVAIRRDVFLAVGGMDAQYRRGAYREESDFGMRFRQAGHRLRFEPRASIYHLGNVGAPDGGSRSWIRNKRIAGWHHCVGDWYFNLGFANRKNLCALLISSLRHFVLNRYNVTHPWWLPILALRWLGALPLALVRRWQGPKLATKLTSAKPC